MTDDIKGVKPAPDAPEAPTESSKADEIKAAETFDRAYVEELRQENAQWRKKVRALEAEQERQSAALKAREDAELTQQQQWQQLAEKRAAELEALQAALKAKDVQMARVKVAAEFGLNVPLDDDSEDGGETLADRLRGETEAELRKDAARLARLFKPATPAAAPEPPAESAEPPAIKPGTVPGQTEARRQTTAVPGGQPVGRTDADRAREYLTPNTDSPIFGRGGLIIRTKQGQE